MHNKGTVSKQSCNSSRTSYRRTPSTHSFNPKNKYPAQVGRNGINFMRVQFPLRTAYAMTINKSQGQTLTRIGLDLRSSPFAHGQLYVALTRAQKRSTVMVLLPHPQIVEGVPYTENVVHSPFTQRGRHRRHQQHFAQLGATHSATSTCTCAILDSPTRTGRW